MQRGHDIRGGVGVSTTTPRVVPTIADCMTLIASRSRCLRRSDPSHRSRSTRRRSDSSDTTRVHRPRANPGRSGCRAHRHRTCAATVKFRDCVRNRAADHRSHRARTDRDPRTVKPRPCDVRASRFQHANPACWKPATWSTPRYMQDPGPSCPARSVKRPDLAQNRSSASACPGADAGDAFDRDVHDPTGRRAVERGELDVGSEIDVRELLE